MELSSQDKQLLYDAIEGRKQTVKTLLKGWDLHMEMRKTEEDKQTTEWLIARYTLEQEGLEDLLKRIIAA
jgi:hypothetical protein